MSFDKSDLADIKWSLLTFAGSLAFAALVLTYSESYLAQARKARLAAQQQLNTARDQLAAAQDDQQNMATYAREYQVLVMQKVIGDEQRLDWMEGLEKLRQQERGLDFKYTISPQASYVPSPALEAGNFNLSRSDMSLQVEMLHEEQLLRFFTALKKQLKGWFMLDGCAMGRADTGNGNAVLKADCTGAWFTMKNRNLP